MVAVTTISKEHNFQSVRDVGYDLFQQALFDGRLKSGQLVSQRDLVSLLNLSIGALRELLPRLEAEGLVCVVPKRGIQIVTIDIPMIRDAFQMRLALEREAVIDAIRNCSQEEIEEQKQSHQAILHEAELGCNNALLSKAQKVDAGFHTFLITHTANEILIRTHNINVIRIRLIRRERIALSETVLRQAFAEHMAIIEAIAARDFAKAMEAIEQHISHARQRATEI